MGIDYEGYIKEKMQKNPITISPDASFYEARALIRDKGIRHLPVVDKNGHLVGILTDRDIREAAPSAATSLSAHELHYLLGKLKVSGFMTPKEKLVTITPDLIIEEAVQLMRDHKIGCLPIMDGNKLAGLITETDILDFFVDVFGLKMKGTRLTVALEDAPGQMHGVLEIMKKHNINIISIVSPTFKVNGKRVAAVRIQTHDYENIVKELNQTGYEVISINKWSPR
ncbi:MAG TPA: CBS and ACT domain-containing protein [Thermodesulfobacteriota bacterium]|nr:CBS and ACT domain-containing protein [Thermodesulfobacteriota bacterium]